jgi:hypothetical protein
MNYDRTRQAAIGPAVSGRPVSTRSASIDIWHRTPWPPRAEASAYCQSICNEPASREPVYCQPICNEPCLRAWNATPGATPPAAHASLLARARAMMYTRKMSTSTRDRLLLVCDQAALSCLLRLATWGRCSAYDWSAHLPASGFNAFPRRSTSGTGREEVRRRRGLVIAQPTVVFT